MKHLFILNPVAGNGKKTAQARAEIIATMANHGEEWEIYETTAPRDATQKVIAATQTTKPLRIYACGGDGTLSECVNGAVGLPHVAVTAFPTGTGNDFIKSFGAQKERFLNLNNLLNGQEMALDVISLGGHYGINICSVGLDAKIGADVHKYSALPLLGGKTAYTISLLANVLGRIATKLSVSVLDKTHTKPFTLICICNGQSYGGAFTPVPQAQPHDGILDILLVDEVPRWRILNLVGRYKAGKFKELPHLITHIQSNSITICADHEFAVNVDGEIFRKSEVTFTLVPGGVNFIAP